MSAVELGRRERARAHRRTPQFPPKALLVSMQRGEKSRYAGLTPAQWECMALLALGLGMWRYIQSLPEGGTRIERSVMARNHAGDGSRTT